MYECHMCHKKFDGRKKKYCSDECRFEYDKIKKREVYRIENGLDSRQCNFCSKPFTPKTNGASCKYCSESCVKEVRRAENRERNRKAKNLYEKYEEQRCCKQCSLDISDRSLDTIFCSKNCGEMYRYAQEERTPWEEYLKAMAEQKERTQARIDKEREKAQKARDEAKRMREIEIKRAEKQKWESLPVKQCVICDRNFRSLQPSQVTCSDKCRRSYKNQVRKAYSKNSKYKTIVVDKDITVEKLFERDKGVCHICQQQCSFEDYTTIDGAFVVGKHYPSVDHVIPRSKGGVHSWDNVKLAHHYCNSIKNDCQDKKEVIKRLHLKRSALEGV